MKDLTITATLALAGLTAAWAGPRPALPRDHCQPVAQNGHRYLVWRLGTLPPHATTHDPACPCHAAQRKGTQP
jgi:hypothetical protein